VAFDDGLWVAVGNSGQLRTSTDAITWTTRTSQFGSSDINSVAYGEELWVAGGASGQIRTSTDAVTWVTQTSLGTSDITSVSFGSGLWVAGDSFGELKTSTDAITWVTQDSTFGNFNAINSVAFGNELWVAGGAEGILRTSTDAVTWVTQTSTFGTSRINSVAFANGLWVAVGNSGQIRTSADAITWVTKNSTFGVSDINDIAYGDGLWVAAGDSGQLRTSTILLALVGLVDGDILEIDTYAQEVALNGNSFGKRFYLETLADWINLNKGSNSIQISYLENPIIEKSITNDIATIETFQEHNFRVGDSIKIQGVDEIFDGIFTVTLVNSATSFSFSLPETDVAPTVVSSATSVVSNADSHIVVYYRSGWLG
jgi:hypothetical protein